MMVALGFAAMGCNNDLPLASQISHMRVLGAALEVAGDAARTTPMPGETARMTWSMAYPDPTQDNSQLAAMFFVCTAPKEFAGTPVCQELLDIAQGGSISAIVAATRGKDAPDCAKFPDRVYDLGPFSVVCVSNTPKLDIPVEHDFKADAKLVRGTICRNATPQFDDQDPTGMSCKRNDGVQPSDVEGIAVYGTVPIQYSDDDKNENPSTDAIKFAFHDPPLEWTALSEQASAALNDDDCLDASMARRVMHSEGSDELIALYYDADAREIHDGKPEALELSGYCTFGKLGRRFTVFDSDAEVPLKSTFHWSLSVDERTQLNGKSKRVRFYFTVMDHRGGYAVVTRDLCVDRH